MRKGTSAQNHLASLVKGWRQKMSGKSVWNAYSSLSAFFRDAALLALLALAESPHRRCPTLATVCGFEAEA